MAFVIEQETQGESGFVIEPNTPAELQFAADVVMQLRKQAGPRGFTYAGRVVTSPEESPQDILSRVPLGELEAGGQTAMGPQNLAFGLALGRGATNILRHPVQTAQAV